MLEPLVRTIEVPCGQEHAFNTFVDLASWWPTDRFATAKMRGATVAELKVDAVEGGQIAEIGSDGQTTVWGTFKRYDPFSYLNLDFHIPHPSEEKPGFTTVEVRFKVLDDDRTEVELTQSNWEALGDVAAMVQGGYGQAWTLIFEGAYSAACTG